MTRSFFVFLFVIAAFALTGCGDAANKTGKFVEPANSTTNNDENNIDPATCGDGALNPGELCDPLIEAGQPGACPTECSANACASAMLTGSAEACTATCQITEVACQNGDGCCPSGCTPANDSECTDTGPVCGNSVIEAGELCDGDCPTSCDSNNACSIGQLFGSAAQCDASCQFQQIQACQSGDGCCPAGCTFDQDSDCNCQPRTCQQVGAQCGMIDNGCGTLIDCGACTNGSCSQNTCIVNGGGNGGIGDACTVDTDCMSGDPNNPLGMPVCTSENNQNFCTFLCVPGFLPCPTGSACEAIAGSVGCLPTCNSNADCRSGFTCRESTQEPGRFVCAP